MDFMKNNYAPNFEYQDFAPMLKAELWDPVKWALLFKHSGAKFVCHLYRSQNRVVFCKGTSPSRASTMKVIPTGLPNTRGIGIAWMSGREEIL